MSNIRTFCTNTIDLLKSSGPLFGENYTNKMLEFYGLFKYATEIRNKKFGVFSSVHGPEFFVTVIKCLDGFEWPYTTVDKETGKIIISEYEKNFYDFIKFYRTQS